jgi:hypothetical protein
VGLDGIEPSASALSELGKGLVRRLVYSVICHFVPRRATQRRFVPFRLGTPWARVEADCEPVLVVAGSNGPGRPDPAAPVA